MSISITVAAYNLLHRPYADTYNQTCVSEEDRQKNLTTNCKSLCADILCLQECSKPVFESMKTNLSMGGFQADHKEKSEGVAVLYNAVKFKELSVNTSYIQEQGPATGRMRAYVCLTLIEKTTGKIIRIVSAHFPGGPKGQAVATDQVTQLHLKLAKLPSAELTVIAGDLNTEDPGSIGFKTYSNDGSTTPTEFLHRDRKLDHILCSEKNHGTLSLKMTPGAVEMEKPKQPFEASDHLPVVTQLTFTATVTGATARTPLLPRPVKVAKATGFASLIQRLFCCFGGGITQ